MKQELLNLLKQLRISKNLKQDDVAAYLGIGNGTISNYENGKTEPDIDTFMKMCNFYGVDGTTILQEAYAVNANNFELNDQEQILIKKYRSLNENGKGKIDDYMRFVLSDSTNIRFEPNLNELCETAEEISAAMRECIVPINDNTNK